MVYHAVDKRSGITLALKLYKRHKLNEIERHQVRLHRSGCVIPCMQQQPGAARSAALDRRHALRGTPRQATPSVLRLPTACTPSDLRLLQPRRTNEAL